jgi:hypothetical protein
MDTSTPRFAERLSAVIGLIYDTADDESLWPQLLEGMADLLVLPHDGAHAALGAAPGMALSAWLQLPGNARPGFLLPRSAVLRHDGRTWVYVQEEEEKFVRKPVTLDTPMDDDRGWFVSETAGGIHAEDLLVLTGAQSLLSEELKAQGGSEPD